MCIRILYFRQNIFVRIEIPPCSKETGFPFYETYEIYLFQKSEN
jgi:hypothetical protein